MNLVESHIEKLLLGMASDAEYRINRLDGFKIASILYKNKQGKVELTLGILLQFILIGMFFSVRLNPSKAEY